MLQTGSGLKRNKWNFYAPFCTLAYQSQSCHWGSMSLPTHHWHVPDGWVIACLLRAVTWLQLQVEGVWSFLHTALTCLITHNQSRNKKPNLSLMEMRWRHLVLLGFVLCVPLRPWEHLDCMEDVHKFPLCLFTTDLSTQATIGTFRLHVPISSVIRVKEEELCSEVNPLASSLLCF